MHTWRVTCISSLTSRQQEKGWSASVSGEQVYRPWASFSVTMSRSMRSFLATRQPDACRYSFPPLYKDTLISVQDGHITAAPVIVHHNASTVLQASSASLSFGQGDIALATASPVGETVMILLFLKVDPVWGDMCAARFLASFLVPH